MLTLPLGAFPLTFHVDGMALNKDGQPDCPLFNPVQLGLQRLAEIERRKAERALSSAWELEDGEEIVALMVRLIHVPLDICLKFGQNGEFRQQFQKLRRMQQYVVRYDGDSKRRWDELCARVEVLTARDGRPGSLIALRGAVLQQVVRGDIMSVSPPPQPVPPIDYIEISSGDEMQGIEEQKPNLRPKPPATVKKRVKFSQGVRVKVEADSSSNSESDSDSDSDEEEGSRNEGVRQLRSSVARPKATRRPVSGSQPGPSDGRHSMAEFLKRRHVESPRKVGYITSIQYIPVTSDIMQCKRCLKDGNACQILADRPIPGRACIQCRSLHRACSHALKA